MDYRAIGEPVLVKDGFLCISEALEVISLLPLNDSTTPEKLLRQWMVNGQIQGLLVDANNAERLPIVSDFWLLPAADPAFKSLIVSARVHVGAQAKGQRTGWIEFQSYYLRDTALALMPVSPDDAAFLQVIAHDGTVKGWLAQRRAAAFDEAVRRCRDARAAGVAAEKLAVPVYATPETQERVRAYLASRPVLQPTPTVSGRGRRPWRRKSSASNLKVIDGAPDNPEAAPSVSVNGPRTPVDQWRDAKPLWDEAARQQQSGATISVGMLLDYAELKLEYRPARSQAEKWLGLEANKHYKCASGFKPTASFK